MASRPRPGTSSLKFLPGGERFGHDRAHGDDRGFGIGAGFAQPVTTLKCALAPGVVGPLDLSDASGGEAEVGTLAGGIVDQAERFLHHRGEFIRVGRLIVTEARLAERDQRRVDRLVRAAFGSQRDPARCCDQQEARVLVAGVVEAIEATGDERVVECPDRKEPLPEQVARQAGRPQHQEEVALRDTQLDMLAIVAGTPFLRRRNLCLCEDVGSLAAAEQAALVHPCAEVCRDGDVRRCGDDAVGEFAAGLRQVEQDTAKRGLRRLLLAGGRWKVRHGDGAEAAATLFTDDAGAVDERLDAGPCIVADALKVFPLLTFADTHRVSKRGELSRIHQTRVIVLVAGEGQAVALDRPGDEEGRNIVLCGVERLDQALHAMAAEVGEQQAERGVIMLLQEGGGLLAQVRPNALPPRRAALVMKRRKLRVRQLLKPAFDRRIAVERAAESLAVAQLDHAPAATSENLVEALEHAVGAGRIEALAIVVDDPPQVADIVLRALDDRFIDIAFVELGITDQRDEAAAVGLVEPAVRAEIILHEAGEEGDRDSEADRTGREVDGNLVLGPARIALRAAEAAEILEGGAALRAEQIVDRVQHRPGVRLHRDPVVRAQSVEIERRHDRRHRGAARLVPADLQPVGMVPNVIGVVDGPRRQPAQPLVEDLQRFNVGGDGLEHGLALAGFFRPATID